MKPQHHLARQARNDRILLRLVDAVADMGGKAAGELGMGEDVLGLRVEVGEGNADANS
jgi:hypothetical protein